MDFEPVTRFGNITQITLHLKPVACDADMTAWLNGHLVKPMGLQIVIPRPSVSIPLPNGWPCA